MYIYIYYIYYIYYILYIIYIYICTYILYIIYTYINVTSNCKGIEDPFFIEKKDSQDVLSNI